MAYTEAQLAVVCPRCKAAKTARCLEKKTDGSSWIDEPHPERVELAAKMEQG